MSDTLAAGKGTIKVMGLLGYPAAGSLAWASGMLALYSNVVATPKVANKVDFFTTCLLSFLYIEI